MILIVYGNNEKLHLHLTGKSDKVAGHHKLFGQVLVFFILKRKSSRLHSNTGEVNVISGSNRNIAGQKKNWNQKWKGHS